MSSADQEMESLPQSSTKEQNMSRALRLGLLLVNCTFMVLGTGGPLLLRVYFLHGGNRIWLSSLVQVAGWPLVLIPLTISYIHRCRRISRWNAKLFSITPLLTAACAAIGILMGLNCYLFAFGPSYLPVSTSAILSSTQMAFIALFALAIVKQRFTPYSINSVVLLTVAAVVLGIQPGGDRPASETKYQYYLGFIMTIAAAALYAFTLPLTELMYMKAKQKITYSLVMEMQLVASLFGTAFCTVGMLVNKDFQAIPREAREYRLGEVKYYVVLILGAFFWQIFNLGLMGTIACSSSLFAGVVVAALLPLAEIIAVVFFHEIFNGGKGVSLALSLWGLASYLYGEWKQNKKMEQKTAEVELPVP